MLLKFADFVVQVVVLMRGVKVGHYVRQQAVVRSQWVICTISACSAMVCLCGRMLS